MAIQAVAAGKKTDRAGELKTPRKNPRRRLESIGYINFLVTPI